MPNSGKPEFGWGENAGVESAVLLAASAKSLSRTQSAEQHFYQLNKPSQDRKRRQDLERNGDGQDHGHIDNYPEQHPLREWRVRWFVVGGPGKCLFPSFLRNVGRPDFLERHPGAVSRDAALARNGVSQPERIAPPYNIDCNSDHETHKRQDQQTGEVDIANPEARCKP